MELSWSNVTVTSRDKTAKKLLNAINGKCTSRFMAIMGPSGSGKTTLLNVLARRANNIKFQGEALIDGKPYTNADLKNLSGYVMQDDLLSPHLTVQETLDYTAKLRLPPNMDEATRQQRVEECLNLVGLGHVRDVIVGDPSKKGISGGERKRLCVATELLSRPKLLFLDEPTSGLDSVTALSLCHVLKQLTQTHCTVVCTIHQPQAKIFNIFDDLMLLCKGALIYFGPAQYAMDWATQAGYPCPPFTNPADHLLDVLKENEQSLGLLAAQHNFPYQPYQAQHQPFPNAYPSDGQNVHQAGFQSLMAPTTDEMMAVGSHGGPPSHPPSPFQSPTTWEIPQKKSWGAKFLILLQRSFKEQARNRAAIFLQIIQTIAIAVLIGTVFLKMGKTQTSVTKRQPVLFFCCVNQGIFGAMTVINLFPSERILMLRERAAGTYPVSAYLLARSLAETIMQVIVPIVFTVTVYFLAGLQHDANKFFTFMGFMILCSLAATSIALLISALCRTTSLSVIVLPMALEVCRLFGGYFLSPKLLPKYFKWLDVLSYLKYSYVGVALNEFTDLVLTCTEAQKVKGPNGVMKCPVQRGEETIALLGMNEYSMGGCVAGLVVIIIVCRIGTYLGLRFIKW